MIPRYSRPEMAVLFGDDAKFGAWLEVEILACEAWAELGVIPLDAAHAIRAQAGFTTEAVLERERTTDHDVAAFVDVVQESVGAPAGVWVHYGLTSTDVVDTAQAYILVQAIDLLATAAAELEAALIVRAREHCATPCVGRTHGIHAEPTTFGTKPALWAMQVRRDRERIARARTTMAVGKLSGAVGTYSNIDPRVEEHVAKAMGLSPEPVSTQVIPRDRHAMYFATLAVVASSVERLAIEIRHLQRTEVLEAEEFFSEGQKGSSAMPHKRNPVLTENLTGLARMVRAYSVPAMENVALWHERDISHSSVERMIGPDATVTLDFALSRLAGVIEKLIVYPENMKKNLDRLGGLVHSQRVLLALTQKGVSREDSYAWVQRNAMPVWRGMSGNAASGSGDFLTLLKADKDVHGVLSDKEIEALFDLGYHTRHVDTIFRRVFGAV